MNKFEKKLKKEVDDATPNLQDKILARVNVDVKTKQVEKPSFNRKWLAVMPIMAVLIAMLAVFIPPIFNNDGKVTSYKLMLSVNPSIELVFNTDDTVISQQGLNEDGIKLLYKENLVGLKVDDATSKLISLMDKYNYLENNAIKINVIDNNKIVNTTKYNQIEQKINNIVNSQHITLSGLTSLSKAEIEALEDDYELNKDKYQNSVKTLYDTELKEGIEDKINKTNELINYLTPYAVHDSDVVLADEVKQKVLEYVTKYNMEIEVKENKPLKADDAYDIIEDLKEEVEELTEIKEKLESGSVEDFDDLLEDIIEIVKEGINKK